MSSPSLFIPPLESPNPSPAIHSRSLSGHTPAGRYANLGPEHAQQSPWAYSQGAASPFIPSPAGGNPPQLPRSSSHRGPPPGTDPNRPVNEVSPGHWVYTDTGMSTDYIGYPSNPSSTRPSPNAPPPMNFSHTPAMRPGVMSAVGTPWSPNQPNLPPPTPQWGQPPASAPPTGAPWGAANPAAYHSPHQPTHANLHPHYPHAPGPMPPPPQQHPYQQFQYQPAYPPHPSYGGPPAAPPPHVTPYTPYSAFPGQPQPSWGQPQPPPPPPPPAQTYTPGYAGYQPAANGYPAPPPAPEPMPGAWNAGGGWGGGAPPPPMMGPGRPVQCEGDDTIPKFMAGPHYGPAMEPFDLHILGAKLELNPILLPPADTAEDFLKWNMLFPSSSCHRSTDPAHVSWSRGRDEPATWPRITKLNAVALMFTFDINATDPTKGVTCGDVVDQTYIALLHRTAADDYSALKPAARTVVAKTYRWNRSTDPSAPGGRLGDGMRRLDFLGQNTIFGGFRECSRTLAGDRLSGETGTAQMPWLFELVNSQRLHQTQAELEQQKRREREAQAAQEARERAAMIEREARSETASTMTGRSERRRSRHAPTIETVSDEDMQAAR